MAKENEGKLAKIFSRIFYKLLDNHINICYTLDS